MKNSLLILLSFLIFSCTENTDLYVCTPCDLPCDELSFSEPGICPHCDMALIKKSDLKEEKLLEVNQVNIQKGSGEFWIEGGIGKENSIIKVFYHKPVNFNTDSRILLVIPGAGRNGDSYRDAWIEEAEKFGVLILSPMYDENDYAFEDYHLCGLMYDLNLENAIERIEGSIAAKLDEDKFTYKINTDSTAWIFNDFDRIFDLAAKATNSNQTKYDIFGHSAGGQILHRFAMFQLKSKADKIFASNSGFYTLPDADIELPFGIKNTSLSDDMLGVSFRKNLILLIGELDNQNETGGTLLRSPTVDKQGLHRLERASFFYNYAKSKAKKLSLEFNWDLIIVPDVGHNHEKMGDAAAKILYENLE